MGGAGEGERRAGDAAPEGNRCSPWPGSNRGEGMGRAGESEAERMMEGGRAGVGVREVVPLPSPPVD